MNIAVVRALDILRFIGNSEEPMSLTDISKALNIPKTTTFNIINTLVEENCLVVKDKRSKLYDLGIGIYEIGNLYINKLEYLSIVREAIKTIKETLSTSSFFCIVDNDELIYVDKVETSHAVKTSIRLGHRMPMYSASLGKTILSFYDEESLDSYLNRVKLKSKTNKTITDKEKLKIELQKDRINGYAISDEENDPGLFCIAAPVFNYEGKPFAAISASFVKMNVNDEIVEKAKKVVVEQSQKISRLLGYRK
ncbi:MAG: IclR family transcriptional regulator [Tissierellia bacterium]|nr:IclR family transcriptional regulator [Tissierellia bacterium]MDD4781712.1 IclR family transcriptional regulator [Tissierellia bacterium]